MQCNELIKTQFVSKPIDQVFSFFSKPENLERITPKYLHFKIHYISLYLSNLLLFIT